MKNTKRNPKTTALISSALLTGAITGISAANLNETELFNYQALGSGAELRTELLGLNKSALNVTDAVNSSTTIKFAELKCGEGKCGGEDKKSEKKEAKKDKTKASDSKSAEATCGNDKKEAKKDKTSESKCGEGKCG